LVKFQPVNESQISHAIVKGYIDEFLDHLVNDVIIVGAGPSGLMAARELANNGKKVLLVEGNNYLGGGFWAGGFLMNKVTIRKPADEILRELNIPYTETPEGQCLASSPHACANLVSKTCESGAMIGNMIKFEDIVLRDNNRVGGIVINWSPVYLLPKGLHTVDPIAVESKLTIDATGHEAVVVNKMVKHGLLSIKGEGSMWVNESEDKLVEKTGELHPGLLVTGMAVCASYGLPRMGPTFGSMLVSGRRVAQVAMEKLAEME
jgi:thiamine thiazole synthase